MHRRQLLSLIAASPLLAAVLAACGSADNADNAGVPGTNGGTADGGSLPSEPSDGEAIDHPTGADELVLRVDWAVGGFVTREANFAELPVIVIAGDGTTVRQGAQIEIFPQPLLPALESATLTEDQLQTVLRAAQDAGLLAEPPDYDAERPPVTDVGSTVVRISAGGASYTHSAFALGMEQGSSGTEVGEARARLAAFVERLTTDLPGLLGAEPTGTIYAPDAWAFAVLPVELADYSSDVEPTVLPWPDALGEVPAADTCVELAGDVVATAFAGANQLTFYDAGGTIYAPLLRPLLPGSTRC